MSASTDVLQPDTEALAASLQRMGLLQPGELPVVTPLTGGVSSTILRLDLPSRSYCFKQALPKLRVSKDWFAPVSRRFSEIAYLREAARLAPGHFPQVLGEDAEQGAFVMEYFDTSHVNWKNELLAGRIHPGVAEKVALVLAAVHCGTAGNPEVSGRFANDDTFMAIRLEPYLLETARQHPSLARKLRRLVDITWNTKLVLVHGDVSPKNILVNTAGEPVLLDAECAWYGDPAFDLAFFFNHLLLKAAHLPNIAAACLADFRKAKAAYFAQVQWEPAVNLEQRVAALLPAMVLARIDGKSPVEYLTADGQAVVRRNALFLLEKEPLRLEEIVAHWEKEFVR